MAQEIKLLDAPSNQVSYQVPGTAAVTPLAAVATFNGGGAAGAFLPCLSFYAQSGDLLGRYTSEESVATGDTAVVSFGPSLRPRSTSSTATMPGAWALLVKKNLALAANTGVTVPWASFYTTDTNIFSTGLSNPHNNQPGDTDLFVSGTGFLAYWAATNWASAATSRLMFFLSPTSPDPVELYQESVTAVNTIAGQNFSLDTTQFGGRVRQSLWVQNLDAGPRTVVDISMTALFVRANPSAQVY